MKVSRPICGLFQGEVCLCYYLYTPLWPALFTLLLNLIESGKEEKKRERKKTSKGRQSRQGNENQAWISRWTNSIS